MTVHPHNVPDFGTRLGFRPAARRAGWALMTGLLLLMIGLVAACGSSSGDGITAGSSNPDDAPQGSGDIVADGIPGSEEFGLTMEGLARRVEEVEAAIATCMAAQGFEYIPVDFDTMRAAQGADKSLVGVSDDDYLAQYGFGITTLLNQPNTMVEIAKGPNASLFDALAPEDQVAYNRTLLGENLDVPFVVGLEEEDFSETDGCTRDAVEQFFTEDEIAGSYVNPGDVRIDNDPRMVAAIDAWSDCVADDGHNYDTPDDLDDDLVDQLDAIVGDQDPAFLAGESLAALVELQGLERAVAPLSEECEDEHIGPVEEEIEIELYGAPQG